MIVLDSNVWIALFDKDDSLHGRAQRAIGGLKERVALPEYVILEVTTVLAQKAGKSFADSFLQKVYANRDIQIIVSSGQFLDELVSFYLSSSTKNLSFVDYALLFLSRRMKILTFDKNLEKALK
ncbi:MAG: type II toxin-antitoxin system VapC family toxin [Candidatus Wildermuthbacteria bacterium]|nr:type II toxin-antitoxin system VapC family toxin [Candidatus Wildermuthbacteria bacterium]